VQVRLLRQEGEAAPAKRFRKLFFKENGNYQAYTATNFIAFDLT
jgi:hypothetical protein